MTKKNLIYAVVLASFALACIAVYLFLTGSSTAAAVTGAVAVSLTGAASRGRAQQATEEAQAAIEEAVTDSDELKEALAEASNAVDGTEEAMREVEVEELTPEEKLALLGELHKEDGDA